MRTIKFRGKTVKTGQWLFGSLVKNSEKTLIFPEDAPNSYDNYIVIHETVGQFTGLHDKNGKEIYEGDIVKELTENTDNIYYIIWSDENPHFVLNKRYIDYVISFREARQNMEIIGNIYEQNWRI